MASKTANVTARVQPDIKAQAERVLEQLGIPVSVLIDSLYRQIIMTNGIPYSLTVPPVPTLDTMSKEDFDNMLNKGLTQAKSHEGMCVTEAFQRLEERI